MFKDLYAIAKHTALSIMVTPSGDKLSLIIIPKPHGTEEKALATPLQVSGTPEELDALLPAEIARYCTAVNGLRSNLGETIDAVSAAAAKAEKKADKKPARTTATPAKKKKAARPKPPKPTRRASQKPAKASQPGAKPSRPTPPKPSRPAAEAKPAADGDFVFPS